MTAAAITNSVGPSGNGTAGSVPERRPRFAGRFVGLRLRVEEPGTVTLARDLKSPEA